MKVAFPESSIRRADILLASVTALIFLGFIVYDFVLFPQKPKTPPAHLAPAFVGWSLIVFMLSLYAVACLGVALGKRAGFGWMLFIGLATFGGRLEMLLLFHVNLTLISEVSLGLPVWQTAYCVYRLWIRPESGAS